MDSSSTTDNSLFTASLEAMDVKTLFKYLDLVTKTLKQKVKEATKGRRRKNKSSDPADGASTTSSKREQPAAVAAWNVQCKNITALYKASLPEGTKLKPGFHLRLAGAVKHLAGENALSVTAESVAAAVAFLEQNPDWSTKTKASRAAKKNSSSDTEAKVASKPSKPADPESDADSESDAEPEVKPKKVKAEKPKKEKAEKKAEKPKKAKKPAKKAESDDESSDSDSEPEVKPKKAPKKAAKAEKKAEKPSKAEKKAEKKAKKAEPESESDDDDGPAAERIKIDGVNYWVNPSSNDVYEDVDGSLGDKIGKLNEDGDGIAFSA